MLEVEDGKKVEIKSVINSLFFSVLRSFDRLFCERLTDLFEIYRLGHARPYCKIYTTENISFGLLVFVCTELINKFERYFQILSKYLRSCIYININQFSFFLSFIFVWISFKFRKTIICIERIQCNWWRTIFMFVHLPPHLIVFCFKTFISHYSYSKMCWLIRIIC